MKRERRQRADASVASGEGSPRRRPERVAHEIQRVLGQLLVEEIGDARAAAANITRVTVTPDLRHARVYYALLTAEVGDPGEATAALTHAAPFLRRRLAHELALRFTPDLQFFYDEQLAGARRIDKLLRDLHGEDDPQ